MKRVRITTRKGHKNPWSFVVYDSVESAFCLRETPPSESEEMGYSKTIEASRGDILEVEWMGAEWLSPRDLGGPDETNVAPARYDLVRVAHAKSDVIDERRQPKYVEIYSGWISGDALIWVNGATQNGAKITRILTEDESSFDFSVLFSDDAGRPVSDGQDTN
jgi:hypothetical protein